jgi:pimeloyl-ACP methyl ester carboxylesterase
MMKMSWNRHGPRCAPTLAAWLAIAFVAVSVLPPTTPSAWADVGLYEEGCVAGPFGPSARSAPLGKYPVIFIPGTAASFLWGPAPLNAGQWVYWFSLGQLATNGIPPLAPNMGSDIAQLAKHPDGSDVNPNIQVGDIFRTLATGGNWGLSMAGWANGDIYQDFIDFMKCQGYTENDRFVQGGNGWFNVFPYDWRGDPAANAVLLANKVQDVLQRTGASKVILIAHSQGGLVARSFIAGQYQDAAGNAFTGGSRVAAFIDIATPWLGTVRVTQAMTVGWNFGIPGMNPGWGQILAPNWPAVYAMSPTASGFANTSYFSAYPQGFLTENLGATQVAAGDAASQDAAIRAYNPPLYDATTQWRSQVFDASAHGVANYLIVGYNHTDDRLIPLDQLGDTDTIDRIQLTQQSQQCAWWQFWCDPGQVTEIAQVHVGPGDDTVPLGSGLLGQMPAYPGPQGANAVAVDASPIGPFRYYIVAGSDVAHMQMPNNLRTLAIIKSILAGREPLPPGSSVPQVTSVSPAAGTVAGGTPVVITGSGFTGATAVTFGSVQATGTVVSDGEIKVTAPPAPNHTDASVDVQVQGPAGTSATSPSDVFHYISPPDVEQMTPAHGPAGTRVTLTGLDLGSTTSVAFGSAPATFSVTGDGQIVAVAPPGTNGTTVHVTVTNAAGPNKPYQITRPDGSVATANDPQFTYDAGLAIQVTTTALPDASVGQPYSQTLQATGGDGHFTWSTGQVCVAGCTQYDNVVLGEAPQYGPATLPAGLTLDPDGTIHGTPTGAPGQVSVPVVVSDQSGDTADGQITLDITESAATCAAQPEPAPSDGSPVVSGVSPSSLADTGPQTITISGYNLSAAVGVSLTQAAANVYISASDVQVQPDGTVKAVTPATLPDGTYDVVVTLYHTDFNGVNSAVNCHDRVTVGPGGTTAPSKPTAPAGQPTGTFSPTSAAPGQSVTLSGTAQPGTVMSVYLDCSGCSAGGTHVGVAQVAADGTYTLSFQVPAAAMPGPAYVQAGCDTCGNGWSTFNGLTITGASTPAPPAQGVASGTFSPTAAAPGQIVTLTGNAEPGTTMSAFLNCTGCAGGGTALENVPVGGTGWFTTSFQVPAGAQPGPASVRIGCDTCGDGWSTIRGLTITAPAPQPGSSPSGAPTGTFSPTSAMPGQSVTLSGTAKPGTVMSAYLYCAGCDSGGVHVGVAQVGGDGSYSLSFQVPSGAQPGPASVAAGCDTCGNGWTTFSGLTIAAPSPTTTQPGTQTQTAPQPAGPPVVSGVSPNSGSDAGGTLVTLSGSGLGNATSVMFGDFGSAQIVQAAPDGTWLQVSTPEAWWGDGPVYVQVTTPQGQSAITSADYYTYQAAQPSGSTGGTSSSPVCSSPTSTPFDKQVAGCPGY